MKLCKMIEFVFRVFIIHIITTMIVMGARENLRGDGYVFGLDGSDGSMGKYLSPDLSSCI